MRFLSLVTCESSGLLDADPHGLLVCAYDDEGAKEQAQEYADQGFTNVKVFKGGVHAWQEAGFSLVGAGR
ncbi:MAG: hypothetical protein ABFD16_05035 [Thermoguttaceae bacterium]